MEDSGELQPLDADFFMAALWDAARPASAGMEVPGYEILGEISRGGMGAVYHARQRRPQREVALKVLLSQFAEEPEMLARFQLEARAMAALDHPGILPVYEVGEADGMPFFSMKLASGGTLAERLKSGPVDSREAALWMVQLARAVHHAHQHGVLHRDLKPGNFLFLEDGRLCVSDFGLAKLAIPDQGPLTRTESFFGTPHYMPPEVAAGSVADATVAGDLYSMGAVFYECLCATRPHGAGENVAGLLRSIADDPVQPPHLKEPAVPRDLSVVCMKALEKKPADRYGTLEEFASDIERWLQGLPILARPVGPVETAWRWARRHPLSAALLTALIGVTLVGTALLMVALADARVKLHRSLIDQARAERLLGTPGHRQKSLALLEQAAGISKSPEIRDEATALLARPDLAPKAIATAAPPRPELAFPDDPAVAWRPSEDARSWLSWHASGKVIWWRDGNEIGEWQARDGREISADFVRGGASVVLAETRDGLVAEGEVLRKTDESPLTRFVSVAADGRHIALARVDGLHVLSRENPAADWHFGQAPARCAAAWAGDGSRLAIALGDRREVAILAAAGGELLAIIPAPGIPEHLALDADGELLAIASDDGSLTLCDAISGTRWATFPLPHRSQGLSFADGGTKLRSVDVSGGHLEWALHPATGFHYWREIPRSKADGVVSGMAISPDGRRLITVSAGCVAIWELHEMRQTGIVLLENQRLDDRASAWWINDRELLVQVPGGLERVPVNELGVPGVKQRARRIPGALVRDVMPDGRWHVTVPNEEGELGHEFWPDGDPDKARQDGAPETIRRGSARTGILAEVKDGLLHLSGPLGSSRFLALPDKDAATDVLFSPDGERLLGVTKSHRVFSWALTDLDKALDAKGL